MSDFDIRATRGTTIEFSVTVTNPDGSPVDLTLPGTTLVVTGTLNDDDTVPPLFTKQYIQGNAGQSQITLDPAAAGHDVADVRIDPADTVGVTRSCYVLVDAVLTQPSGKKSTVARGVIKLRAGIAT